VTGGRQEPLICAAQVRAARAWLNWTQDDLAERSGVSLKSIARYEAERSVPFDKTLVRLRATFEEAGVMFLFEGAVGKGVCHA
jgi:transcriptional regulator with XRE-family HTH domain